MIDKRQLIEEVEKTLVMASTLFRADKKQAYLTAINEESNDLAKKILQLLVDNYEVSDKEKTPLCDDTGIPHVILEIGAGVELPSYFFDAINEGIRKGLLSLPGRPMAVIGDGVCRIEQANGLSEDPSDVEPAPILIMQSPLQGCRLHILMLGGGPAIRGKTYRVFHKHSMSVVIEEIGQWAKEAVEKLGCTPCTLAIGIGRSQYEASSLMLMAMAKGRYDEQSELEKRITETVNESEIGTLGVGGTTSVLATFLQIGPQRASGVRIVCMRPCCCFEPRVASIDL